MKNPIQRLNALIVAAVWLAAVVALGGIVANELGLFKIAELGVTIGTLRLDPIQPILALALVAGIGVGVFYEFKMANLTSLRWVNRLLVLAFAGLIAWTVKEQGEIDFAGDWLRLGSWLAVVVSGLLAEFLYWGNSANQKWTPLIAFTAGSGLVLTGLLVVRSELNGQANENRDENSIVGSGIDNETVEKKNPPKPTRSLERLVSLLDSPEQLCVRIENTTTGGVGSAAFIDLEKEGTFVLTAAHLFQDDQELAIEFFDKDSRSVVERTERVEVVRIDRLNDLALLQVTGDIQVPVTKLIIAPRSASEAGLSSTVSIGCSEGQKPKPIYGAVNKRKVKQSPNDPSRMVWEFSATSISRELIHEGRSGGPLLNSYGELIGIASGVSDGKAYFCHHRAISEILDQ